MSILKIISADFVLGGRTLSAEQDGDVYFRRIRKRKPSGQFFGFRKSANKSPKMAASDPTLGFQIEFWVYFSKQQHFGGFRNKSEWFQWKFKVVRKPPNMVAGVLSLLLPVVFDV